MAGLAERIVPFPVAAGRYDKLRAVTDGVVWVELKLAGAPAADLPIARSA